MSIARNDASLPAEEEYWCPRGDTGRVSPPAVVFRVLELGAPEYLVALISR
jgi:hypothetical protein